MPPVDSVVIGVAIDRDERRRRITARLHQRLDHGMVEEMRRLLDSGVKAEDLTYYGLEYKYVTEYVIGQVSVTTRWCANWRLPSTSLPSAR